VYVIVAEFQVGADKTEAFGRLVVRQAKDSLDREGDCHQFDVCEDEERSKPLPLV